MNADAKIIYREVQRFRQPWLWVLLLGIAAISLYVVLGAPSRGRAAPALLFLLIPLLIGLGLPLLLYFIKCVTEVRDDGIYLQFFPMHLSFKRIAFSDIQDYQARTYRPILEYGGWGIRYGFHGKAYNVSGNQGIQLVLTRGKRLLIGTQHPDQFLAALQQAMPR